MAYQLSRRAKSCYLTPEETIVRLAMSQYCFESALVGAEDFIPTKVLYEKYRQHFQVRREPPELFLNAQGFGAALRRVFDIDPTRKKKTRAGWGYLFVQGPGSLKLNNKPGRKRRAS